MDEVNSTPYAIGDCFECGSLAHFKHHVIPQILGGKQTVPLCAACHGKVHGRPFVMNHAELTRRGVARARALGRLRGKRPKLSYKQHTELWRLHEAGAHSIGELADLFAVSRPSVYRALARKPSLHVQVLITDIT